MATRVCPECGSQYVASVRRCIDCDVMLVDEVGSEGEVVTAVATPLGEGDQIAYELEGWGNQLRVTLSGMLDLNGIAHVWEVGALVVAAPHEAAVDELIAAVEGGEAEELDEDVEQIAFELEGVTPDELAALDAELIAAHIPHAWQESGDLLVPEASEDAVAAIIDAILNPEEVDETDGLATHAALSDLYVALDKLLKDPLDAKLVNRYETAADALDGVGIPYGLSGQEWSSLLDAIAELRGVIDGSAELDPTSDEADADDEGEAIDDVDGADDADADEAGGDEGPDDTDTDTDADAGDGGDGDEDDDDDPAAAPASRADVARGLIGPLRARLLDLV